MAISMVFSFSAWMSMLNNFVIEAASFDGSQIGILQSLREIPGFLAFTVILAIIFIAQQRLAYISMIVLGLGVLLTGFYPSVIGLYITTVIMSIGFHYLETLNQSLSLQWLSKEKAPIILGKITAAKSFTGLLAFVIIYVMMKFYAVEYKYVYAFFGGATLLSGILAWFAFEHFKDDVVQEKKLVLKKEYWLFYVLTFFAGARRQIFIVFAGFLLVEKFGVDIHNMVILLFVNSVLNMYIAPKIGQFIVRVWRKTYFEIRISWTCFSICVLCFCRKFIFCIFLIYFRPYSVFNGNCFKNIFSKNCRPKRYSKC